MIHSLVMNRLLTNSELIWLEGGKEYLNTLLIQTYNHKAKGFHEILLLKMNHIQSSRIYIPANFRIILNNENAFVQPM